MGRRRRSPGKRRTTVEKGHSAVGYRRCHDPGGDQEREVEEMECVCRRFFIDAKGQRCRVEYGLCGRNKCGPCFQLMGKWDAGIPFVSAVVRALWIREFYQFIQTSPADTLALVKWNPPVEVFALAKWNKKKKRVLTAADSQFEEEWFGPQLPFPTERRPQARAWESNIEEETIRQDWLQQSKIKIGDHLTDDERTQVVKLL